LAGEPLKGKRILLPRAAVARDLVPDTLRERGGVVDVVEAYRTIVPENAAAAAQQALAREPNWITFTSSSTVKNWIAVAGRESLKGIKVASIGPITSGTARAAGLTVDIEADPHTIEGLVTAIAKTQGGR
jgi:uroporphyrinogen III methyltransferase/synthase